ncbi:MAG: hypothetical protein NT036_01590 [Candidatus Omnitrophica bacterium]|nr:hypothetical protein [Candidatus Omnitrophota bacterium]
MRKLVSVFCVAALFIVLSGSAFGADENKAQSAGSQPRPMIMDKNIAFVSGTISKIDTTAPEGVKLEVSNDVDGKNHVVEIGPGTNVLKVIEVGELKVGDKARIVARKTGDKETAISVVTGKLKELPAPITPKDQTKK